ncbi:MAG: LPXTG cell wall anchor domain-containing protein [Ilumatobacteraceae bacterium]
MRVRTVGLRALAALACVTVGLSGRVPTAAAIALPDAGLGDLIQMAMDCTGEPFAHVHVFDEFSVEIDEFDLPDPSVLAYVHDTATYGAGAFTVTIHCEPQADHHDPTTTVEITYTFTVIAPATTTIAIIPATGSSSTSSMTLIATFAVVAGAGLLLVRRRSLG